MHGTKEFCQQRLGNWVLEKPGDAGGKGGERGGVRGGRGISHAPQEPKAILPGRGITDAATNDTGLGEIAGKGRLGVVHI